MVIAGAGLIYRPMKTRASGRPPSLSSIAIGYRGGGAAVPHLVLRCLSLPVSWPRALVGTPTKMFDAFTGIVVFGGACCELPLPQAVNSGWSTAIPSSLARQARAWLFTSPRLGAVFGPGANWMARYKMCMAIFPSSFLLLVAGVLPF